MSDGGIFVAGLIVTVIVAFSMALLIYGAVLDGRRQEEFEREQRREAERKRATGN